MSLSQNPEKEILTKLKNNSLPDSLLNIAYRMENATDYAMATLQEQGIQTWESQHGNNKHDLPDFVQDKVKLMESKRDWSHWPQNKRVCAYSL